MPTRSGRSPARGRRPAVTDCTSPLSASTGRYDSRSGDAATIAGMRRATHRPRALVAVAARGVLTRLAAAPCPCRAGRSARPRHDYDTNLPKLIGKIAEQTALVAKLAAQRAEGHRRRRADLPRRDGTPRRRRHVGRSTTRRSRTAVENVNRRAAEGCELYKQNKDGGGRASDVAVEPRSAAAAVGGASADGVLVEPLREVQALEHELDRRRDPGRRLAHLEVGEGGAERRAGRRAAWRTPTTRRPRRCARPARRRTRRRRR